MNTSRASPIKAHDPGGLTVTSIFDDESIVFKVTYNDEQQYSIWPADRDLPVGWHDEGTVGTRAECLQHIDAVWTDMRPASLRRAMNDR